MYLCFVVTKLHLNFLRPKMFLMKADYVFRNPSSRFPFVISMFTENRRHHADRLRSSLLRSKLSHAICLIYKAFNIVARCRTQPRLHLSGNPAQPCSPGRSMTGALANCRSARHTAEALKVLGGPTITSTCAKRAKSSVGSPADRIAPTLHSALVRAASGSSVKITACLPSDR